MDELENRLSPDHTVVILNGMWSGLVPDELAVSMDLINEEKKIIDEEFDPDSYSYMV